MLQTLPSKEVLTPNTSNPIDTIEFINTYVEKHNSRYISIDISYLNILDAAYVATMCSTNHFIKFQDGKIEWKISSNLVPEFNKDMDLGNMSFVY